MPRGPDKLEFVNWIFAEKDAPPELREKMLKQTIQLFGTSGMVEQDDSDTWPHMTLVGQGRDGTQDDAEVPGCVRDDGAERLAWSGHRQRRLHQGRYPVALVDVLARADDGDRLSTSVGPQRNVQSGAIMIEAQLRPNSNAEVASTHSGDRVPVGSAVYNRVVEYSV